MSERNKARMELWRQYIQDELSEQKQRELDELLLNDESALTEYMEVFERLEVQLPPLTNLDALTDKVMTDLSEKLEYDNRQHSRALSRRWSWIKHPVTHYAVAASITLLMITSGFFDQLFVGAEDVITKDRKPISDQWLDQATGWLDSWNREKN